MPRPIIVDSISAVMTKGLGEAYARVVLSAPRTRAAIIFLRGDLGSGKTTFARGFLKAFNIAPRGASPTFVLAKHYHLRRHRNGIRDIYHYDAYRLSSEKDLRALGFFSIAANPSAVILIEWPEKVAGRMLRPSGSVSFVYGDAPGRRLLSFS